LRFQTAYPAGYDLYQFTDNSLGSGGVSIAVAGKESAVASDDPGSFGNAGVDWAAITLAIRPAAA